MKRSKGAFVHARILCYDEWSGSRKYYESPRYGADDVAEGKFKGLKVVPIENDDEITGGSTKPGDVVL